MQGKGGREMGTLPAGLSEADLCMVERPSAASALEFSPSIPHRCMRSAAPGLDSSGAF